MWKYGGVYSDFDTITIKSFKSLIDEEKNGVGDIGDNPAGVSNSLMVFQSKQPYIHYVMEEFTKNYVGNEWAANGPFLLLRTLLDYCDIDNIHRHLLPGYTLTKRTKSIQHLTRSPKPNQTLVNMDKTHKCANLTIFPQHYFFPIMHYDWNLFDKIYSKNSALNQKYWKTIESSYSIHFFNKLTSTIKTKPNDKSFYSELASLYCTFTYNYVNKNNLNFDMD